MTLISFILFVLLLFDVCESSNLTKTEQYEKEFRDSIKNGMEWTVERKMTPGPIFGNVVEAGNFTAEVYNSVPYAKPPVGERRFEKPEKLDPWNTPINTTKVISCWQYFLFETQMRNSEDCLYFKIVIPLDSNGQRYKEKLPVLFWIHGGSYNMGSKEYYVPKYIVENISSKKIIFVAPNYRIGVFGFLSAQQKDLPGNNGLEDVILALKVIRENSDNFGIDPDRITVAGESAGAGAASILAASPRTKGLFSAVVLTSGTSQATWAVRTKSTKLSSDEFVKTCKCEKSTVAKVKSCMKKANATCINEQFIAIMRKSESWYEYLRMGLSIVTPVVDDYRGNDSIIPENIEQLVKQEARMPMLASTTTHEKHILKDVYSHYYNFIKNRNISIDQYVYNQTDSLFSWNIKSRKFVVQAMRQFYNLDKCNAEQTAIKLGQLMTDDFVASQYEEALIYAKRGQTVYLIQNNPRISSDDLTLHGVDTAKVFGNYNLANGCRETYEKCVQGISKNWLESYTSILTEFVTTRKISSMLPFTSKQRNAYLVSYNGTELIDYHTDKYYFWRQTIPALEKLVLDDSVTSKSG